MKKNNRNQTIDILKGIAVLAVLLGHAVQRGLVIGFTDNIIFRIIYSFHMPLFMILSGYALKKYTKKYDLSFLKKRFLRLIIPTIIWSYLIYIVREFNFVGIKEFIPFPESILEYTKTLIYHPDTVIWFLYIVFLCDILFFIQNKLFNKKYEKFGLLFSIILAIIIFLLPNQNFGIWRMQVYFPLFSLGYYIAQYPQILEKTRYLVIPCIPLYFYLFPKFSVYLDNLPIFYAISICIIIIIYNLVKYIRIKKISSVLSFFGKYSLEIYLCQCLCLNIGIGNGYLRILSIFITATSIATILSIATNKSIILSFILYGKVKKINHD